MERIVRFEGPDGAKAYELSFEALAMHRPARGMERAAEGAFLKLQAIGEPKAEQTGNPDLVLMRLNGKTDVRLLESERDLLLAALEAAPFPTFALGKKRVAVELLMNAERVE